MVFPIVLLPWPSHLCSAFCVEPCAVGSHPTMQTLYGILPDEDFVRMCRRVQLASYPVVLNLRDLPTSPDRSSRVIRVCTYIFACRAKKKMLTLYRRIEMTNAEVQHLANTSTARTRNFTYTVNSQTELNKKSARAELKLLRTGTLWHDLCGRGHEC